MKRKSKTADQVREEMTAFCEREFVNVEDAKVAYISALTSAAHLCDQVARESGRSASKSAAKRCGDFIWSVADRMKDKRAKMMEAAE